ncbi:type-1 angiotensin II receptor-associated protein [Frankliniella occidentalis]|uniref:Type-1 angiotensin II receptor-associated protein n=1 Tax=Frankliniella occidentalis TaxID=133901 RepID=A0A6J1TL40_FRAOC|nr:type-1 angiotensin II receptor-associated protein [Frankliniella occidentalis]
MVDLSNVQNKPLKLIFLVHFILITWGIQGFWSPDSYLFYNGLFILSLLWGIHHRESDEPLQIAVIINVLAILFDVIVLAAYFPATFRSSERFSIAMAILNLVIRPVTSVILCRIANERIGGEFSGRNTLGDIFGRGDTVAPGRPRAAYDDIDNPSGHQSTPGVVTIDGAGGKQPPPYHG